jgi:PmbA protein
MTTEQGQSNYPDQLIELLRKAEQGAWADLPKITGWRFSVSEGRSVTLSIVDNKLGDVYGPPTARDSLGGGIYIIWEDNKRTSTSIDRRTIPEFEERLQEWRASAFDEEHGPDIREPEPSYPEVAMFDEKIKTLADGDTTLFFQILQQGYKELRASGVEFVDAGCSAGASYNYLRNSKGLNVSYPSTSFSFSFYADSLYGNGYSKRKLYPEGEVERIIEDVKRTTALLKETGKYKPNPQGDRVVLDTGITGSFLNTFILGNLYGSGVANGQSAFKLDDFREHKQIMRPDMNLVLDGTRPYEYSASRLTSEGIPGGREPLVEKGKLVTPILDLKYSGITGFAPTRSGGSYFEIDEPEKISLEELIKRVDNGLLVYSLLGMHTQDGTSGRYSVGAPKSLVIENGELKGKVKATLVGNFFENVMDERSRFGWDPHEDNPAMEMTCQVIIEE